MCQCRRSREKWEELKKEMEGDEVGSGGMVFGNDDINEEGGLLGHEFFNFSLLISFFSWK